MKKVIAASGILLCAVAMASSCQDAPASDVELMRSDLVGGNNGNQVTSYVRGYTRPDGTHGAVFRGGGVGLPTRVYGTPFTGVNSGGQAIPLNASPWGFTKDGLDRTVYVASDSHVHVQTWVAGTAGMSGSTPDVDLSASPTNGPLAAPAANLAPVPDVIALARPDNKTGIIYRSQNNHVWEILSASNTTTWSALDLTVSSGATISANRGSAFPYVRADGRIAIVYIGNDDHIHELSTLGGASNSGHGTWSDADLSAATGNQFLVPSSDPWGYKRSDGYSSVIFMGTDSLMHEFASSSAGSWGAWIMPAVQPAKGPALRPSGYIRADGVNAVVYLDVNKGLHELKLTAGGWADVVVPVPAGVLPLGQMFGHVAPGGRSSVLFLGLKDGISHGYELTQIGSGPWAVDFIY